MSSLIQLSIGVTSYAAEDPGTWEPLFDAARIADQAGVDRLVVSDHVVFGERLEEYGRPEIGGSAGGGTLDVVNPATGEVFAAILGDGSPGSAAETVKGFGEVIAPTSAV